MQIMDKVLIRIQQPPSQSITSEGFLAIKTDYHVQEWKGGEKRLSYMRQTIKFWNMHFGVPYVKNVFINSQLSIYRLLRTSVLTSAVRSPGSDRNINMKSPPGFYKGTFSCGASEGRQQETRPQREKYPVCPSSTYTAVSLTRPRIKGNL